MINRVERLGLAVWVKDLKAARSLKRIGNIHYISKRLKYVYLYIDAHQKQQLIAHLEQLPYVQKVEPSRRKELSFHRVVSKNSS